MSRKPSKCVEFGQSASQIDVIISRLAASSLEGEVCLKELKSIFLVGPTVDRDFISRSSCQAAPSELKSGDMRPERPREQCVCVDPLQTVVGINDQCLVVVSCSCDHRFDPRPRPSLGRVETLVALFCLRYNRSISSSVRLHRLRGGPRSALRLGARRSGESSKRRDELRLTRLLTSQVRRAR